jgi:hypothetical protein
MEQIEYAHQNAHGRFLPFLSFYLFPNTPLNNVAIAIQRENNSQSSDKMSSS